MAPRWVTTLIPIWIATYRLRKILAGHFNLKPSNYGIYTNDRPGKRVMFEVKNRRAFGKIGYNKKMAIYNILHSPVPLNGKWTEKLIMH
jgi:hypothetical protein